MSFSRALLSLALMCLFAGKGFAGDFPGEIQVTPRLDIGAATVRNEFSEPERSESLISGFGFTIGYLAPFHLIVEAGVHFQEESTLFLDDSAFNILELSVQAGVDIPLGSGWHLAPKFGRVHVTVEPSNKEFTTSGQPLRASATPMYTSYRCASTSTISSPLA